MTIIEAIKATTTKAELKLLYLSDIKPIKTLHNEVDKLERDVLDLNELLSETKTSLNSALPEGVSSDQIMKELRTQLGFLTESTLE